MRDVEPLRVRIVVVARRGDDPWVLLTSLPAQEFPAGAVEEAYVMRWRVETRHAQLVSGHFGQAVFHAKWAGGVEQEVYAQPLFVAITPGLVAAAIAAEDAPDHEHVSPKAALLAVGDHLTRLLLRQSPERARTQLDQLLRRIASARYKPRPGRSCPRRSFLPGRKWGPDGKRGGA